MSVCNQEKVPHLVVDTVAFLKRARLETFGSNIYTLPQVLKEIRDDQTREFVKSLTVSLNLEAPQKESVKIVSEIAKKTGDLPVLSSTDLNLLALTYEMHKKYVGTPTFKEVKPLPVSLRQMSLVRDDKSLSSFNDGTEDIDAVHQGDCQVTDSSLPNDEDWITEENFSEKSLQNFGLGSNYMDDVEQTIPTVACLTTDFAMQNVLFHTGLNIVSLNGMKIRQPRAHILWCRSCYEPTKRTDTYFCPACGHGSLARIPVTLHEDGQLEFHFSRKFVPVLRGLTHVVRKPKGGKYADELVYCADQRLPDRRPARPKNSRVVPLATNGLLELDSELINAFDHQCDLNTVGSFFPLNDTASRAAVLGIRSDRQIPPRSFHRQDRGEHGLKPTRATDHLVKARTGNKRRKPKI